MSERIASALEAAYAIRKGELSARELTEACLARISVREDEVQAWAFLDPEHARAQADERDRDLAEGRPPGALHGLPVGIKDIVDTRDMPTENGTVLHRGRRPERDATIVAWLRAAGAVILGKTVTTELAVYAPGKTRNPHDPTRTPGGSSSGSAAAVAAGMVPLAIGTQTNGSVIRPAAYCGIWGLKPSHGLIPRTGVLAQSRALDTIGTFASDALDLALFTEALIGRDPADPDTFAQARPSLLEVASEAPPVPPRLAFVRTPVWAQAEPALHKAFERLVERLGSRAFAAELPEPFEGAHAIHQTIMEADQALSFDALYQSGRGQLSARMVEMIERGQRTTALAYNRALAQVAALCAQLEPLFESADALLTPATTGEAPEGLASTGSPAFCTIWTLLGLPAVSVPLLKGPAGMPIGVQLVGRRLDDARLLRTARWLADTVAQA